MFGFSSFYSILILIFTLFYFLMHIQKSKRIKDVFFYVGFVILLFFSMCRGESVGGDLAEYIPVFQRSSEYKTLLDLFQATLLSGYEFGFIFLCKLISLISLQNRCFIVVTAILTLLGPFYIIYKYSNDRGLSLILYLLLGFYNVSLNNIRQAIALSIIMLSICSLIQQKEKLFWLGVLLATLIHTSAIFTVLFYPLIRLKYTPQRIILYIIIAIVLFLVLGSYLFNYLLSNVFTRYLEESGETYTTGGGYGLLCVYIFVAIICIIIFNTLRYRMPLEDYQISKFFLFSFLVVILVQAFALYMAALARMTSYFYLPFIILLPNLLEKIRNSSYRRILKIGVFIFFYTIACNTFLSPVGLTNMNPTDTIPYIFMDGFFVW